MKNTRKRYASSFKAKVVIEAIKGQKTLTQIASEHSIHPNQIAKWKKEFIQDSHLIFQKRSNKKDQKLIEELYKQIGQLTMELDWLKKKLKT